MVTEQSKINNLEQEILYLRQEISRLRMILDYHGINYITFNRAPKTIASKMFQLRILPENMRFYCIRFSKEEKMYTAKDAT